MPLYPSSITSFSTFFRTIFTFIADCKKASKLKLQAATYFKCVSKNYWPMPLGIGYICMTNVESKEFASFLPS